ncbi:MAG: glutamate--tRNA ligase, partial [Bacteroidales bacterium]|nr:glutamate--tRNA ligase [Bacteroidales bacterium]
PLQWQNPQTGELNPGYKESGYFPEAFVNILALLGWNPGDEQEVFSMEELINKFSLDRIGKSGARFDPDKAKWFNHYYLNHKTNKELTEKYLPILYDKGLNPDLDYVEEVVALVRERANFVSDFWEQSFFFFKEPERYDPKVIKKKWKENTPAILNDIIKILEDIRTFSEENTEKTVKTYIQDNELSFGQVLNSLRLTLLGSGTGPSLFKIIEMLGKEESIKRIKHGIERIQK